MNEFIKYVKKLIDIKIIYPFKLLYKNYVTNSDKITSDAFLLFIIVFILSVMNSIFLIGWLTCYPVIRKRKIKILRYMAQLNKGRF